MKLQAFPSPKQEGEQIGAGGLALFAAMAAAEVCEGAPTAQARGFFAAIGKRMAVLEPLEGVSDAAVLCARINGFWQDLGWGEVELAVGDDAIVVHHRNLPKSITPDPQGHWGTMMLGLLEGAYDGWFRVLGSGPALHTTARWQGDVVELRHGR
ncbi:cellulose biosynthesis protein BcsD [Novosphingobium aerophilum]|uniref:cellulose biosynthesis protein BcsD n=1 Tax=Novosphingobium TaxID=165696 RepID=UPI0012C82616|nr:MULTISPECIES: hypothetical protein [unclassified Novosphingobium]MPS70596.1 hypothetical protein [Novosphingobium sp.]WRT91429.1 hypothetical protein U9J33_09310 [Novosphingobium sp. RL4]